MRRRARIQMRHDANTVTLREKERVIKGLGRLRLRGSSIFRSSRTSAYLYGMRTQNTCDPFERVRGG